MELNLIKKILLPLMERTFSVFIKLCFLVCLLSMSACVPDIKRADKYTYDIDDLNFDEFEFLIYEIISEIYPFSAVPFISYVVIGSDEDTFYERYYLHAMIDDIDRHLNVRRSLIFPFAFTFDKITDELIRHYFPDPEIEVFDIEGIYDNFSSKAIQEFITLPTRVFVERVEKLSSTNLWKAEAYFGHQ
jgi:hypothetical protein